jgi:hypothetical protein
MNTGMRGVPARRKRLLRIVTVAASCLVVTPFRKQQVDGSRRSRNGVSIHRCGLPSIAAKCLVSTLIVHT